MFKKIVIIAVTLLLSYHMLKAQDSVCYTSPHQFTSTQLIAPAVGITAGLIGTYQPEARSWSVSLRDAVQQDGHAPFKFDNYLQFLPAVSVYGLKLCGLESQHNYRDLTSLMAGSYLLTAAITLGGKEIAGVQRPDNSSYNSFPSGHTSTAFTGAEILRREYGKDYPWVAIAGYTVATGVGAMRIYNNRHWASDVVAGAAVGILSTSIAYWLAPYLRF